MSRGLKAAKGLHAPFVGEDDLTSCSDEKTCVVIPSVDAGRMPAAFFAVAASNGMYYF
jgi:hypothetical protein